MKSPASTLTLRLADDGESPGSGYPSTGEAVIALVAARYPERLRAGVSHDERVANMEFLRDRIIETGHCGGMRVARNLKRGVGPHSIDAIAWRPGHGEHTQVVDIAADYENASAPLRLQWIIVGGKPGWDPGPAVKCR
jgi:hypothetical protein